MKHVLKSVKKKYLTTVLPRCKILRVLEMENFVRRTLLYDFYGELLTEHQREVYEAVVLEDYSVSEVAADRGISRQGIHDLVRRVDRLLEGYEERLGLVDRFIRIRNQVIRINEMVSACTADELPGVRRDVAKISGSILEEL